MRTPKMSSTGKLLRLRSTVVAAAVVILAPIGALSGPAVASASTVPPAGQLTNLAHLDFLRAE